MARVSDIEGRVQGAITLFQANLFDSTGFDTPLATYPLVINASIQIAGTTRFNLPGGFFRDVNGAPAGHPYLRSCDLGFARDLHPWEAFAPQTQTRGRFVSGLVRYRTTDALTQFRSEVCVGARQFEPVISCSAELVRLLSRRAASRCWTVPAS